MDKLDELKYYLDNYEAAPGFDDMPRRTLHDKGSAGPTGAHFIEEVHVPFNLAYISVTTGSTAFQNITGVTRSELASRIAAGRKALELAGLKSGDRLLVTYPPLVNVFCKEALEGIKWFFLERSCRNALIYSLCTEKPRAVIGESSFLRASIEDAERLGLLSEFRADTIFIAAGTPLDLELPSVVARHGLGVVHDLYGCQEYGWLTIDGRELREDISLIPSPERDGYFQFIVGGLPTGDCFPVVEHGHICAANDAADGTTDGADAVGTGSKFSSSSDSVAGNHGKIRRGSIITYSRLRSASEPEGIITHSTANSADTVYRLARTILRIKGKVIRVSTNLVTGAAATRIVYLSSSGDNFEIAGPEKTVLLDALMDAQLQYQAMDKKDQAWLKDR